MYWKLRQQCAHDDDPLSLSLSPFRLSPLAKLYLVLLLYDMRRCLFCFFVFSILGSLGERGDKQGPGQQGQMAQGKHRHEQTHTQINKLFKASLSSFFFFFLFLLFTSLSLFNSPHSLPHPHFTSTPRWKTPPSPLPTPHSFPLIHRHPTPLIAFPLIPKNIDLNEPHPLKAKLPIYHPPLIRKQSCSQNHQTPRS